MNPHVYTEKAVRLSVYTCFNGNLYEPKNKSVGENVLAPKSAIRPRDLRSSNKKGLVSFSRTSAARPSLGATSYAWLEAAERIEAESVVKEQSPTTWPRQKKTTLISANDLIREYDKCLIQRARMVSCEGPLNFGQTNCIFQAIFDKVIKKYWGLRIAKVDPALQNQISLWSDEAIVRVNREELFGESRDRILSILINEFTKPQVTRIALLKLEDLPVSIPGPYPLSSNMESPTTQRHSSRSAMSPVSYIKNLNAFNTRSIGQRITVDLHKLAEGGFGISFATRDTLINTEEMQPVFVERIMPTGAAIHDGRLQFGDRLLSINGIQVTNFKDAMATLRSVSIGDKATLVFSRQDSVVVATPPTSSPSLIDLTTDRSSTYTSNTTPDLVSEPPLCQTIIFDIPVPHRDSGTSSLGIRFEEWAEPRIIHAYSEFKGPEVIVDHMVGDTDNLEDNLSGLFVKQILTGSPASKELTSGSIRPGDRLIAVDGHSVTNLSLTEISTKLKLAIEKAQCKMVGKSKQAFLELTMNRFFHCSDKQNSWPKTKSMLRPGSDAIFDKLTVQNNSNGEILIKKVNMVAAKDRKDSTEVPSRRLARTPSVDSRCRSRRERESRSPSDSPVRCQSAFSRDGVGRRSVSEKRHAHISATNFSHYNDNALPFCNKGGEQASRLYSTMPSSRKIRQIRRSKQDRPSGPIKPVHAEELEKAQEATGAAASQSFLIPPTQKHRMDDSDVLRTDAVDDPRARSHNHSFRAAVNPESVHRSPPPTPPKPTIDYCLQNDIHRTVTPPLPARRSRVVPPTTNFRRRDSAPKPTIPSPSPSLSSPTSSTATAQHKMFEEILQVHRSDKKDAHCFSSSRKVSPGSCDREEESVTFSIASLPRSSAKHVVLTDVRPLASELRKTPSPVEFNAYAVEQKEISHFSRPSRTKSFPSFLEEVETSLPKRRISRVNEPLQVEGPSFSASDPAATCTRKDLLKLSSPALLHDGCITVPSMMMHKNDVSNGPLPPQAFSVSHCGSRNNDNSAWLTIPRSTMQAHIAAVKSDSPHAIVRSRSPSSIHVNEARGDYGRPSTSTSSDRSRRLSHSLNRPDKSSTNPQHQPSPKNQITYPQPFKHEPYQACAPFYSPTTTESYLIEVARDNRMYLLNNQPELPFHPLPFLKLSHPRLHTSPLLTITTFDQAMLNSAKHFDIGQHQRITASLHSSNIFLPCLCIWTTLISSYSSLEGITSIAYVSPFKLMRLTSLLYVPLPNISAQ
ncbi:Partitioning defective protein [Echinococcus granulosus]|uniref:Partitioning defective protein n=1 Tax=Echinococcus granulosus TaxID=6210 RepID=W6URB7_ECHGR|nr:Partitioning defective protein [Echinococcus granulosus]EUB63768.1 Partitioning defective protein [Echinococcus granulosus]